MNKNRVNLEIVGTNKLLPNGEETFQILMTFTLSVFAWIFFIASSVFHAINYIQGIFSKSIFQLSEVRPTFLFVLLIFFIVIEWIGRNRNYVLDKFLAYGNRIFCWSFIMVLLVLIFIPGREQQPQLQPQFIYFQF